MIKVANNWKYHKNVPLSTLTIHSKFRHEGLDYVMVAKDSQAALCKRLIDDFYFAFRPTLTILTETTPKCFNHLSNGDFFKIINKPDTYTYVKIDGHLIFNFETKLIEYVRNLDWAAGENITFLGVLEND
jgi:hypothetical protein